MALDIVYLGQTFQIETNFKGNNEEPLVPTNPAQWFIKDFNGYQVSQGVAQQDSNNPYSWKADVTIPESAPAHRDKKYSVQWQVRTKQGNYSSTEYFTVLPQEGFDYTETDNVFVEGMGIEDSLIFEGYQSISNVKAKLVSSDGTEIAETTDVESAQMDGRTIYNASFDDVLSQSLEPYIIAWSYSVGGKIKREYHFAYVVSQTSLIRLENLRNFIDKIRFSHPNPNLRFNDVDLISYLVQGVQIINGTKPQATNFNLVSVPKQFDWYLTNAAAFVALSAQYIAEGQQAFDFSGQTVSLNVDRTQFLDSAISRIQDTLQQGLVESKTLFAKQSANPQLGLTPSPCLNPRFLGMVYYGGGQDPSFLYTNRGDYYNNLLQYLNW